MISRRYSQDSQLVRLEAHLREQGYNRSVSQHYVSHARRFLMYLNERRLKIASVTSADVDAFLRTNIVSYSESVGVFRPTQNYGGSLTAGVFLFCYVWCKAAGHPPSTLFLFSTSVLLMITLTGLRKLPS